MHDNCNEYVNNMRILNTFLFLLLQKEWFCLVSLGVWNEVFKTAPCIFFFFREEYKEINDHLKYMLTSTLECN